MKNFFNTTPKIGFGTSGKVTGKAADSGYTAQKKVASQTANRETLASAFGLSGSGGRAANNTSSTLGVQLPTVGTGTKNSTNQLGDYSLAKGTAGVLQKGLQRVAEAGGNTLAFAEDIAMAPFELTSGLKLGELSDNAPLNRWRRRSGKRVMRLIGITPKM